MASGTTMKAIQLTRDAPDVAPKLSLVTVPKPKLIPDHVIVKVKASAIHPSDIVNARGGFPLTQFPRIAGRDWAGVIVEGRPELIGVEVFGTSGNTHAFTVDGFQAEYCLVRESAIARKPKNISFEEAATIGVPYTTASLEVEKAGVKESDTVLVIGSTGAVGSAVVQIAKETGARVLTASRRDDDDVNTSKDPELKTLKELTNNRGVDVVIDTVGAPSLLTNAVANLATNGRLVIISAPRTGSTEFPIDLLQFYRRGLTLCGINSLGFSNEYMAKRMDSLREGFESGQLTPQGKFAPVSLDNAAKIYEALLNKTDNGKYVVVIE